MAGKVEELIWSDRDKAGKYGGGGGGAAMQQDT